MTDAPLTTALLSLQCERDPLLGAAFAHYLKQIRDARKRAPFASAIMLAAPISPQEHLAVKIITEELEQQTVPLRGRD